MHWGYTYIERSRTGSVENERLQPFSSFGACCLAAQEAFNSSSPTKALRCVQIIYCRYNQDECLPEIQPVLRTIESAETEKSV